METSATPHPEDLLRHGPRLRSLARQLVRDAHAADDLVQETYARAVEHAPAGGPAGWPWLARVLRNLVVQGRRQNAARTERERAVARPEDEGDEGQRFALHRALVAAIEALEEPYRQTILLRYFDGLPPRRIARRLDVPVKTVKTRLHRGIGMLRAVLDRQHGGRERWMAAFLPLAQMGRGGPWSATVPGTTVPAVPALVAAVVAVAGLYLTWPARGGEPEPLPRVAAPSNATQVRTPAVLASGGSKVVESRSALLPSEVGAEQASAASVPVLRAASALPRRARVLDPEGNGLAGVRVALEHSGAFHSTYSGADGVIDLQDSWNPLHLRSGDSRYATVFDADLDPEGTGEMILVVAPAVTLAGVVLSDGPENPAPDALVRIEVPFSFRGRFRAPLEHCRVKDWSTYTDEQGRFVLEEAPGLACALVEAHVEGWGTGSVPVPEQGSTTIEIELEPSAWTVGRTRDRVVPLVGEVRHADGSLAPLALVAADGRITHSDERGLFELSVPVSGPTATQLVAVMQGEQAALFKPTQAADGTMRWPPFVTLVLGPPALSIGGIVLGTDGAPVVDAPVWIEDLSFVGKQAHGPVTLEHLMAGETERQTEKWLQTERWSSLRTGKDGRFELTGLLARGYTLAAMDPATLQVVRVGPVEAGSRDVVLSFPEGGLWERVAGRVVDRHGTPLAGLSIWPNSVSFRVESPEGSAWRHWEHLTACVTDDQGRFEFRRVSREGASLVVLDLGLEFTLDPSIDPLDVVLELPCLRRVQVEFSTVPTDGKVVFLDGDDRPLTAYADVGFSVWSLDEIDLSNPEVFRGERTPALSVPDTVAAVVLRDAHGLELRRVPVTLGEGLTVVRL